MEKYKEEKEASLGADKEKKEKYNIFIKVWALVNFSCNNNGKRKTGKGKRKQLFVLSLFNLCMFKIFASNDGHSQTL
jgi:hypothetical protein